MSIFPAQFQAQEKKKLNGDSLVLLSLSCSSSTDEEITLFCFGAKNV